MNIDLTIPNDADGIGLSGVQTISVSVSPKPLRVELYVDDKLYGVPVYDAATATFKVDTSDYTDGTHIIRAEGVYKTRRSRQQFAVTFNNANPKPELRPYGKGAYGSGNYGG